MHGMDMCMWRWLLMIKGMFSLKCKQSLCLLPMLLLLLPQAPHRCRLLPSQKAGV